MRERICTINNVGRAWYSVALGNVKLAAVVVRAEKERHQTRHTHTHEHGPWQETTRAEQYNRTLSKIAIRNGNSRFIEFDKP